MIGEELDHLITAGVKSEFWSCHCNSDYVEACTGSVGMLMRMSATCRLLSSYTTASVVEYGLAPKTVVVVPAASHGHVRNTSAEAYRPVCSSDE